MLAHGHQAHASVMAAPTKWSPTRDHTELSRGASERIAHNAFTRAITRVRVRQHSFPRLHACFPAKRLVHPVASGREIRRTLAGLFHRRTPALSGSDGPLDLLRVQEVEMVRASGNAPEPGTNLVRCGV